LKELDFSGNQLSELTRLSHLNKLKRIQLSNNRLVAIDVSGLIVLELLVAPHNALRLLPAGLVDLKALLHLDLSHNQLGSAPVAGWADLAHLKALRVLTLSHNNIAMALNEFYAYILAHLKKLAKLEYLAFEGNPIETSITSFSFFCIGELPKLKFMDWKPVSKNDRAQARVIEAQGTFDDHVLPPMGARRPPSESMRQALEFSERTAHLAPATLKHDLLDDDLDYDNNNDSDRPPLRKTDSLASLIDAVVAGTPHSTEDDFDDDARKKRVAGSALTLTDDIDRLVAEADAAGNARATSTTAAALDAAITGSASDPDYLELLSGVLSSDEPLPAALGGTGAAAAPPLVQAQSIDLLLDELAMLNSAPSARTPPKVASPPKVSAAVVPQKAPTPPPEPVDDDDDDAPPPVREPAAFGATEAPPPPTDDDDDDDHLPAVNDDADALDALLGSLESHDVRAKRLGAVVTDYESPPPSPPPAAAVEPPPAAPAKKADEPPRKIDTRAPPRGATAPVQPVSPRASQLASIEKPGASRPDNVHARVRDSAKATIAGLQSTNIIEVTRRRELERSEIEARKSSVVAPAAAAAARAAPLSTMDALDELLQQPDDAPVEVAVNADFRVASRETVEFLSRLGLGTYGDAYQGLWRGDAVVLKKLRQQTFHDDFLREFQKSVRALANVSHAHVLAPIAVLTELDVCAVTPYISNGNLKTLLESPTLPLDGAARLELARQIASAVDYLHERSIIHRTLTPTNVLLDDQHNVLISDYGLCELKDSIRFRTQQLGRQPAYFAPELFPCERADMLAAHLYDRKVDVYAFGVLLWAIWSRVEPFADLMPRDVPPLIRQGKRPPLEHAKAPPVFEKLMQACWHDEPAKRPEFTSIVRVLAQPAEVLLVDRLPGGRQQQQQDGQPANDSERKLAAVTLRLCEMLASPDAAARLKAAETAAALARDSACDRVFANTPLAERLATLLATRGAGVDVFNAVMRAIEAIGAHPLSAERLRRAAVLPTLLAAVRLAPLRDAALSALGVLARQSARVRDALKPLDGLAAFADVLRDGGASEATLALAAWCAASAMMDASVRDDAIALPAARGARGAHGVEQRGAGGAHARGVHAAARGPRRGGEARAAPQGDSGADQADCGDARWRRGKCRRWCCSRCAGCTRRCAAGSASSWRSTA
jgi:hypothetical protein